MEQAFMKKAMENKNKFPSSFWKFVEEESFSISLQTLEP
jgi:hypothetical protein